MYKILNCKYNLTDIENNSKVENTILAKDMKFKNDLRRSIFVKSKI